MLRLRRIKSPQGGYTVVPCDVEAYVIDKDPNGLNVRSGPGKSYAVIGNLAYKQDTGVGVHITGSNGDWVQIDLGVEEGLCSSCGELMGSLNRLSLRSRLNP